MAEKKYYDIEAIFNTGSTNYPDTIGVVIPLTYIAQGNTDVTRIGDKVTGTSLEFNVFVWSPDVLTQSPENYFRITIVIWKDDDVPGPSTVYQTPGWGASTTGTATMVTPFNHQYKSKRKILYDGTFCLYDRPQDQLPAALGFGARCYKQNQLIKKVIPLTKLKNRLNVISYTTSTNAGFNHIYALISSENTKVNGWNWDVYSRYNFTDV